MTPLEAQRNPVYYHSFLRNTSTVLRYCALSVSYEQSYYRPFADSCWPSVSLVTWEEPRGRLARGSQDQYPRLICEAPARLFRGRLGSPRHRRHWHKGKRVVIFGGKSCLTRKWEGIDDDWRQCNILMKRNPWGIANKHVGSPMLTSNSTGPSISGSIVAEMKLANSLYFLRRK